MIRPLLAVLLSLSASAAVVPDKSVAAQWMQGMTLREKIGQLMIVPCFGEDPGSATPEFQQFQHLVRDLHVGGIIVANRIVNGSARNAEPHAMATFLNRMQRISKVPLVTAGDLERGASMRVAGTTKFPHLMAFGSADSVALTKQFGAATAKESRALGIHWVFAPDADVNVNADNPVIGTRSFSDDPRVVSEHVRAFIEGAHSDPKNRVLVTAKHFPGHGDTNVDSHYGLPILKADKERIQSVEFAPFRAAIAAGTDSVMSAHMSVPALDPEGAPSTVSHKILTGILRNELKFNGIVITDAMDMQGMTSQFPPGEAAVRAIEAGADILLMPPEPAAVLQAVEAAVRDGRITRQRLDLSVRRILEAKVRLRLHQNRYVDIEKIADTISDTGFAELAQAVADRAITTVKNQDNLLPLKKPSAACFWVLSDNRYSPAGRLFLRQVKERAADAKTLYVDPLTSQGDLDTMLAGAAGCEAHVVAAFRNYPAFADSLVRSGKPVIMTALGSPYMLRNYPGAAAQIATFTSAPPAEAAAVKALFGEIPTRSGPLK